MHLRRYVLALLVVLCSQSPLGAQDTDEDGQFYLDLAGSAVFPYDPAGPSGAGDEGITFEAGTGVTAAFGYAFPEGFSTEMEWGYQHVGISHPTATLSQEIDVGDPAGFEGFAPPITIDIDGALTTHSLMGNIYYRYPRWRVSPYAGFGVGAFFHDGAFTSTVTLEDKSGTIGFPTEPFRVTVAYEDARFAYQIMGGLSVRASRLVAFRLGYRFRSSRGAPIDADHLEAGLRFQF